MRRIDTLVLHHSAGGSGSADVFRKEHIAKGFGKLGYHAVICNGHGGGDGEIQWGTPAEELGAGVKKNNTGCLHVCLVGNFHKADKGYTGLPTHEQMKSLGAVLTKWSTLYGSPLRVCGHRDKALPAYPTACPGDQFPTKLISTWFSFAMNARRAGRTYTSLDSYLEGTFYWGRDEARADVPVFPLVHFIKDGTELTLDEQFARVIDGATWVQLRGLGERLGWPAPESDKGPGRWIIVQEVK